MNVASLTRNSNDQAVKTIEEADDIGIKGVDIEEWFLRFIIVAMGIGIGAIVALFIGLFTGWIPFVC